MGVHPITAMWGEVETYTTALFLQAIFISSLANKSPILLSCPTQLAHTESKVLKVWRVFRKLNIELSYDSAMPLMGIYLEGKKTTGPYKN